MQISAEKIWESAQEHLRAKLSQDTFNMWFAPLRVTALDGSHISLSVPNEFCEVWLKDNYIGLIQDAVAVAAGCKLQVKFKATADSYSAAAVVPSKSASATAKLKPVAVERFPTNGDLLFNPKNTFESFVVGGNNNLAFAVSKAVAEAPGKAYNPLFLYGGVGLGKTHLLQAIGQHVVSNKKSARVAYVSSEKFTNEYIDAIQNNKLVGFRKKYRHTDVLLIDDVQFFAGKERIQEEFSTRSTR
jgi:chromosomal replication initiator protein